MKALDLWLAPDLDVGRPLGCVATSFTLDAEFFEVDCLSRFLGLETVTGEGGRVDDVVALVEMEERLAETPVAVVVDRSCSGQRRNLRWDVLPASVDGALLHAKVAVLVWERAVRLILGSANLTKAGYRNQVEVVAGFDFYEGRADLPLGAAAAILDEVEDYVAQLTPTAMADARRRATATLGLARDGITASRPPAALPGGVRVSMSPTGRLRGPGSAERGALDGFETVWKWSRPTAVQVLSPFWDTPGGNDPTGLEVMVRRLSGERGAAPKVTAVVPVDVGTGDVVRAPRGLLDPFVEDDRLDVRAAAYQKDTVAGAVDERRVHAKFVLVEGSSGAAAMFGSSNATRKGLGLDRRPHREMNLWISAPAGSKAAKQLRNLVPVGDGLDLAREDCEMGNDEDETVVADLPRAFEAAVIIGGAGGVGLRLYLDARLLPAQWTVLASGEVLASSSEFNPATELVVPLNGLESFPQVLSVRWADADGNERSADWAVVVSDPGLLPPVSELRLLPVDLLLTVLASTRPLRELGKELARNEDGPSAGPVDNLLARHTDANSLLHRVRRQSAALAELQRRLERPVQSVDALRWRLFGALGPVHLADRIVEESGTAGSWLPGEAGFLLAELALTVSRSAVDAERNLPGRARNAAVADALAYIEQRAAKVTAQMGDPALVGYVEQAFEEVGR